MDSSSSQLFTLAPSPHVKHKNSTKRVMLDVLIALAPALIWGVIAGGIMALTLTATSIALCMFYEWAYQKLTKKPVTVTDLSAAVTGALIAFNLPVTCPPWLLLFGCFFAIVVVKQLFGGIGKNIINPAIAARIFMFISWPSEMTGYENKLDTVSSATPLAALKAGNLPEYSVLDSFLGKIPGCIGEISTIALIIGGVYLIARRIITWHIPVTYLGTVAVFALIFPLAGTSPLLSLGYQLFSGGLLLGAIFMATDYTTSPVTPLGRIIFGFGCGILTVAIRYLGAYPEGVSFAIMIMNMLVWYIDKATTPKPFGTKKQKGDVK